MTADKTAPDAQAFFRSAMNACRRGFALAAQIVFGGLVVLAAGVLAVATAVIGLILALAAIVIGLASGKRPVAERAGTSTTEDGVTLEAHRTPDGWTVE